MDNHPFSPTAKAPDSPASHRRSTRIDYITTVLLSGKDASGTPFREITQTSIVNLHGCRVRTSYRILVGMLVTIECPRAGASGKGVCVKVWDPTPGVAGHDIGVQLIKPQNLWAVPNPPPDWEIVAKTLVQGRAVQAERPARPAGPEAPSAPVAEPRPAPVPPAISPLALHSGEFVRPAPVAAPTFERRSTDLEQRRTQLVASAVDIMRGQAEEIVRNCLEEFRQQVDAFIQDCEKRLLQGLQQGYDEATASWNRLRSDLLEQMRLRGAQLVRSNEDILRARLRAQLAGMNKAGPEKPPDNVSKS